MIEALNALMLQANAKKMVITLTPSRSGDDAIVTIATELNNLDISNPLQNKLAMPLVARGYVGSLETELSDAIRSFEIDSMPHNNESNESVKENDQSNEIDSL